MCVCVVDLGEDLGWAMSRAKGLRNPFLPLKFIKAMSKSL